MVEGGAAVLVDMDRVPIAGLGRAAFAVVDGGEGDGVLGSTLGDEGAVDIEIIMRVTGRTRCRFLNYCAGVDGEGGAVGDGDRAAKIPVEAVVGGEGGGTGESKADVDAVVGVTGTGVVGDGAFAGEPI